MSSVEDTDHHARALLKRPSALVLAIGTANPPTEVKQSNFPDYYFKITNNEHQFDLKDKFRRICEKTAIEKRHFCLTEKVLQDNPNICRYDAPSLDARMVMMDVETPKLGYEAAMKAIEEWGRPKTQITHLIFCNSCGASMPGADSVLLDMLGLPWNTKRFMLYQVGCFAGGTVLRLAKDIAENNAGARILAVCSETFTTAFRGPCQTHIENLVGQALFGDGAGAVIVGAEPVAASVEQPIFELVSAGQYLLPDSRTNIVGNLREKGLIFSLEPDIALNIGRNIEKIMVESFGPLGVSDSWNSLFFVVHPGGRAVLDVVEKKLGLRPEKLKATRDVLKDHGNMMSACVLFIMDLVRKRSREECCRNFGEGFEWGVLFGFGPGLTVESIVLKSCPCV
ncbi:hypothetical protein H6P81_021005 [Aristolochia fimbriata]|uniref:Chalcone synthase n=1 Tax=Aristolochia fimbriata TaxID=158543 RepID=A0AAV7DW03_ARIFI|nr:hypothetical protein H6P81_021005 [Aristolochia fimbriata]